jgi:hypothetical protein
VTKSFGMTITLEQFAVLVRDMCRRAIRLVSSLFSPDLVPSNCFVASKTSGSLWRSKFVVHTTCNAGIKSYPKKSTIPEML